MTEKSDNDLEALLNGLEDIEKAIDEHLTKLDLQGHLKELEEVRQDYGHDKDDIIDSFCDRAKILYKNNKYEDAITLLKEGLKYFPDQPKLICYMGFACLAQESWEAKTYFQRALRIDHEYPLAHYGLGIMELKLGVNPEAAQRRYKLLMIFDPSLALILKDEINKYSIKRR
jgi:tetratricopeptide (TPR) repeat protein